MKRRGSCRRDAIIQSRAVADEMQLYRGEAIADVMQLYRGGAVAEEM